MGMDSRNHCCGQAGEFLRHLKAKHGEYIPSVLNATEDNYRLKVNTIHLPHFTLVYVSNSLCNILSLKMEQSHVLLPTGVTQPRWRAHQLWGESSYSACVYPDS